MSESRCDVCKHKKPFLVIQDSKMMCLDCVKNNEFGRPATKRERYEQECEDNYKIKGEWYEQ